MHCSVGLPDRTALLPTTQHGSIIHPVDILSTSPYVPETLTMSVASAAKRASVLALGIALMVAWGVQGASEPSGPKAFAKQPDKAASDQGEGKASGRLPPYYSKVVNEEQRQQIYAIQRQYAEKTGPLKRELARLSAECNQKIESLLTPEQKMFVEGLKTKAKNDRESSKKGAKTGKRS